MDLKRRQRKVLRTTFTKTAKELNDILSGPDRESNDLRQLDHEIYDILLNADASEDELLSEMESSDSYMKRVIELNIQCEDCVRVKNEDEVNSVSNSSTSHRSDHEIYDLLLNADASEDELLSEMDSSDSYMKRFIELNIQCEDCVRMKNEDEVNSVSNSSTSHRSEFKKFDGNIKDWLTFWLEFQKVHEDFDIDLSDKVEYLILSTVAFSRARQLVDSFSATDCLRSRFGRENLQIEVYVRELLKLVINNTFSSNKINLSLLYDKLES
ncbi:hypothetical protein HUJ04_012856 [Dendroctonus ponderosae]|nr:hypothetical protein HUJ04_012856 [Dendroctonus ponderosae]